MSLYPRLILKPGKESSVERRHPWIFSGALKTIDENLADGEIVEVYSNQGKYLATGHFQQGSIMVRVLSFEQMPIDETFWEKRLKTALKYRESIGLLKNKGTNAYRLVNAEGDCLPGLVIDIYNGTAVLQAHSAGMERTKESIAQALVNVLGEGVQAIYSKHPAKEHAGGDGYLWGKPLYDTVLENGNTFFINWEEGQKTGFFLDQRENRQLLAKYAKGKDVLNAFCYSGGFSVYALKAGARSVWSVDSSKKAIDWTERNIGLNNIDVSRHKAVVSDVQEFLKQTKQEFEVMVLDPPAYAKHLSARHQAVQGYKRLNVMGLSKVKKGGILFTFSCSQVVDAELFSNTIMSAAIEANRNIRIMHRLGQPADHAVNIFHPEGSYLKGLVLYVE
ncbi:MAG: class I SAM-dependent rRNA methyltransferase [Chitinophagales bacterium]|nr:class I SAM-dependent rRNA methyltransferase [Chitinophagales bacterium]